MQVKNPALVGLLQAIGVIVYVIIISVVLQTLGNMELQLPEIIIAILMLTLLVFSAALSGSLVFGYPAILALDKKIKEAVSVVLYTLLFLLAFGVIFLALIASI